MRKKINSLEISKKKKIRKTEKNAKFLIKKTKEKNAKLPRYLLSKKNLYFGNYFTHYKINAEKYYSYQIILSY